MSLTKWLLEPPSHEEDTVFVTELARQHHLSHISDYGQSSCSNVVITTKTNRTNYKIKRH